MDVALAGATGKAGSRILAELVRREHRVTAIVRNPERVPNLPGVTARKGDAGDRTAFSGLLTGHDAVISSMLFAAMDPDAMIGAVRASGVKRYLVVGGSGSLEVAPGVKALNTPDFPAAFKEEAAAGDMFLEVLRRADDLEWTFLSPSGVFGSGERTGRFRLGGDRMLVNDAGSGISFEDFAVALIDELEKPTHVRQRFTVGY